MLIDGMDTYTYIYILAAGEYQTFVFTATLGKEIRYNIKSRKKAGKKAPGSMGKYNND